MNHANRSSPHDNKLRHCREWVEITLLTQTDKITLASAGLLAGEILLLSALVLWSVGELVLLKGPFPQRVSSAFGTIGPWLPFVVVCTMLSLGAAQLAQWGTRRYRRGRLTASIALIPVAPVIMGFFLKPPLIVAAPILGILSTWLVGEAWWQLFLLLLRRLAAFDYWAQLEEESKPRGNDWLYEHRAYLETKKTALVERKLRWKEMADPKLEIPPSQTATSEEKHLPTGSFLALNTIQGWAMLILIGCLIVGSAWWQYRKKLSPPHPAVTPTPSDLVFWYQALEPEAALLQDLVLAYNNLHQNQPGAPAVLGHNQVGDLSLEIFRAEISSEAPDVVLVPQDLADGLRCAWGTTVPEGVSGDSTGSSKQSNDLFIPLWPDYPWRQRLVLVISPTTKLQQEAQAFVDYLYVELSQY